MKKQVYSYHDSGGPAARVFARGRFFRAQKQKGVLRNMRNCKKITMIFLSALLAGGLAFAQAESHANEEVDESTILTIGKQARLGVEAGTEFVWDIENSSTGLETNLGIEFYLPLIDPGDRGVMRESYMQPGVRLVVKDMCFQWLETFFTKGGNYEQDAVNSWVSRPLVLSYGDITADVVWKNFFLQVAGTTNPMEVDQASLVSIFDDVMDTDDRWYLKKEYALYSKTRYNKLNLPLLGAKLDRNYVDPDYKDDISGQLGVGVEFSKFTALAKAASLLEGRENDNNAWYFGLDASVFPVEAMSVNFSGLMGLQTVDDTGETPLSAGLSADYKIPLVKKMVLKPFVGADFFMDTEDSDTWRLEAGAGAYLYYRGEDFLAKHRDVDYDEIIPVGLSVSANLCMDKDDTTVNLVFSAFELADRRALIPNLGYFVEFEMAGIGGDDVHTAVQGQVEYLINGKILPYVNAKYYPALSESGEYWNEYEEVFFEGKVGCYLTPVQYFSLDLWYKTDLMLDANDDNVKDDYSNKGELGVSCVIRL